MRADYYFAAARDLGASKVCQALGFNRLASIIDPDENFYREEYLFNALNCFDSIEEEEQKNVLKENIDIVLSDIPKKERWYFIKLEEANILSAYAVNIDPSYAASAEDAFNGLIEEYPNISQVYLYYSYHKLRMKEYSEVPELTSKAESLMPKLTLPLYFLNMIHRQSLASELVRVHEMTAVSYESRGEYGKAAEYYEKAIKANPYRFADYKRLADMYYFQGDIDTAIKYNQRGYSMNKNDFSWPLSIALLLKEKGDEEGAVDYARQALNIDPENKEASDIVSEYKEEK